MKRRKRNGMSKTKAGLIGLVVLIVFTYLGFTKFANPFSNPYTVQAVFANANQLRPSSEVRIAGVNVGKVQSVQAFTGCSSKPCSAAKVTMTIEPQGLPLHKDATFAIRPRIFLEGNFFVDIHPGSPSAPVAPSGYTFPIQQGIQPVQFDQVLTSLQSDTRHNLQILLDEYGIAVKQGGPAYNRSIQYWLPAYKYTAMINHDLLGLQPHDLSNFIDNQGTVAGAIDNNPPNLKSFVSDFDTTAQAFAVQQANLQRAVADLPTTLRVAIPTFTALNSIICAGQIRPACPPGVLPTLANALIPGVKSTGPMVDASLPLFNQLRLLVQPSELGDLSTDLRSTIPALTRLTRETIPFMANEVRPASACDANVIYPWSQLTVPDSHFNSSNGFPRRKVYVEGVDYLPGLAGESRNFDSISPYIRVAESGGGTLTYTLSNGMFGQALSPLAGTQPSLAAAPGDKRPPLAGGDVANYPCETQPAIKSLAAPSGGPPPNKTVAPSQVPGLPLPIPLPIPKLP
jgi:phospholipid/cholesterol/gamma-HCH transport system substrate-binding protein